MKKNFETKFTAHYVAIDPIDGEEVQIDVVKKRGDVTFTPSVNVCSLSFSDILELAEEIKKYDRR